MNQLLGFLTAFFVVGWAVRWYFRQGTPAPKAEWQPPKEDTILPSVTKWETMDDVTLIEPFSEPRTLTVATPRYVESTTHGEVEKRLEALVEADEPPTVTVDVEPVAASTTADAATLDTSATLVEAEEAPEAVDASTDDGDAEKVIGFCARCRDKREVLNPARTQTKKGKAAIRGTCKVCGAGMFVFISEDSKG